MEINVEQIMQEIRSELEKGGDMEELPPFESVPIRLPGEAAPISANPGEDNYAQEVEDMNRSWELHYFWPLSPNPVKRFIQRVIKRLLKFLFVHVMEQQNAFNASTVRSMICTKTNIDSLTRQGEELKQRNVSLEQKNESLKNTVNALEQTTADLFDISSGIRLRVDALEHKTEQFDQWVETTEFKTGALDAQLAALQQYTGNCQAQIVQLTHEISGLQDRITVLEDRNQILEAVNKANEELRRRIEDDEEEIGALAREITLAKWKIIDHTRLETEKEDDLLTCKICGSQHRRSEYKTLQSECIFNGGKLTRYICPDCGVVFGPSKFTDQGQKEIDEDYRVHYLGFSEGDSLYKEEMAFRLLNPEKGKIYLNYGCGKWSKTLQKLRAEGYMVYGYEPYAIEVDNPYLITNKEELAKYRFDGIFSNDVLEHFVDPVEELQHMKSLLMNKSSRMAHSTACYTYKYEYTRFHTHFFLGESVKVLAEKAGLEIAGYTDDLKDHDFMCYIFAPKEIDNSILDQMVIRKKASFSKEGLLIRKGGLICGPYLTLSPGKFAVQLDVASKSELDEPKAEYKITLKQGALVLNEGTLFAGGNEVTWESQELAENFEIVIEAQKSFTLQNIRLFQVEN